MISNVVLGLALLAVSAFITVSGQTDCDPVPTTKHMQKLCRHENERLDEATAREDSTELCLHYQLILKCAVTALPHCYDFIHEAFAMYQHSPFSCQITESLMLELQEIVKKGTRSTISEAPPDTTASSASPASVSEEPENTSVSTQATLDPGGAKSGTNQQHRGSNSGNGSGVIGWSKLLIMLSVMMATVQLLMLSS